MNASSAQPTRRAWLGLTAHGAWAFGAVLLLPMVGACSMRDQQPRFGYTLLDGSRKDSTALVGRVTLVNFWATTCAICVAEMPQWTALHQELQPTGRFETLAVAMSYDPPARVAHFAESRRLPFGVVIDNTGEVARAFGDVRVTPSLFLLDMQGRIAKRYVGKVDVAAVRRDITGLTQRG